MKFIATAPAVMAFVQYLSTATVLAEMIKSHSHTRSEVDGRDSSVLQVGAEAELTPLVDLYDSKDPADIYKEENQNDQMTKMAGVVGKKNSRKPTAAKGSA